MRVVLIALGVFVAICAMGVTFGVVVSCLDGQGPELAVEWVLAVGSLLALWLLAGGLFYAAHRVGLRERRRQSATEQERAGGEAAVFECRECGDTNVFRGPVRKRWYGFGEVHVMRCLTCGWRRDCPRDVWRRLPDSALGDPYETRDDVGYHMLRDPMSRGQTGVCVAGLFLAVVAAVWVSGGPGRGWLTGAGTGAVAGAVAVGIVAGAWWLGRWLFPPARRPRARRCSNCGYDLRWLAEQRCPECGVEFEGEVLAEQMDEVSGEDVDEGPHVG